MRRVIADFLAFGKQYLRSKEGTFFAFAFPVLLILLFGSIFSTSETLEVTLHIQNLDLEGTSPTDVSQDFIRALENTSVVNVESIPTDVSIQDYIRENSLSLALLIPEGFEGAVNLSKAMGVPIANVTLYGDPSRSTYQVARAAINSAAIQMSFRIQDADLLVRVEGEDIASEDFQYIDYFLPGVLGITILTSPLFAMAGITVEYKNRGFLKLLATTPISKSEWLLSKILWFVFLIFASFAFMLLAGALAFGVKLTITPIACVIIIAGVLLFTSLGLLLGGLAKDSATSIAIANAIGFPMMFLSGSFFPLEMMPSYLQTIAMAMPLTYVNNGLRDTMVFGNTSAALGNLAVVLVIALIFFVLAAKLTSWKK